MRIKGLPPFISDSLNEGRSYSTDDRKCIPEYHRYSGFRSISRRSSLDANLLGISLLQLGCGTFSTRPRRSVMRQATSCEVKISSAARPSGTETGHCTRPLATGTQAHGAGFGRHRRSGHTGVRQVREVSPHLALLCSSLIKMQMVKEPLARSGWGVYYSPTLRWNTAFRWPPRCGPLSPVR